MKRKSLILLLVTAALGAALTVLWFGIHKVKTTAGQLAIFNQILLTYGAFKLLSALRQGLKALSTSEPRKKNRERVMQSELFDLRREMHRPEAVPGDLPVQFNTWQNEGEQSAQWSVPTTEKVGEAPVRPSRSYAELIRRERLQMGLSPHLQVTEHRTALTLYRQGEEYCLVPSEHWLEAARSGSDLLNQQISALFYILSPSPGGRYIIHRTDLLPARLRLLEDGSYELIARGSLHIERC